MSKKKKTVREKFRRSVFLRSRWKCEVCGAAGVDRQEKESLYYGGQVLLDAHHITPREEFDNGGYVESNGIALCGVCHLNAEEYLMGLSDNDTFSSDFLYKIINSSFEKAKQDDSRV